MSSWYNDGVDMIPEEALMKIAKAVEMPDGPLSKVVEKVEKLQKYYDKMENEIKPQILRLHDTANKYREEMKELLDDTPVD